MSNGAAFPSDWGPGCPPSDAEEANGIFFRATKNDPPTADDFLSMHELGMQPKFQLSHVRACRWRAVSLYRTLVDIKHYREAFPGLATFIAKGTLSPECGKTKHCPSQAMTSHTEWWSFSGVDRTRRFETVRE
jgi:hypothetical protein